MNDFWCIDVPKFGLLRVAKDTIKELSSFQQLKPKDPESGGVLVGMHLNSGGKMVINGLTPPQPTDEQGRYNHYRSEAHGGLIEVVWEASEGHSTYVGLWHTHPEPTPLPSSQDIRDWKKALQESKYHGRWLFFFIVGQKKLRCWSGYRTRFTSKIRFAGEIEINDVNE